MPLVAGTWAEVADATELTGVIPSARDMALAQIMIENRIRRVWRSTDTTRSEYRWLQQAVAFQGAFIAENPTLFTEAEISSTSQDGWSVTFKDGAVPRRYANEAIQALNMLPGSANVTIRFNSGFQSRGRRRRHGLSWRRY